eukprot:scaffold133312_cov64-Phaeocystis_antarctica.AAC.5
MLGCRAEMLQPCPLITSPRVSAVPDDDLLPKHAHQQRAPAPGSSSQQHAPAANSHSTSQQLDGRGRSREARRGARRVLDSQPEEGGRSRRQRLLSGQWQRGDRSEAVQGQVRLVSYDQGGRCAMRPHPGLTAHRWRRCVRRPEHARAKPARDHGTAGREGAPRQRTFRIVPCTRHRPTVPVAVRSQRGGQKYTKGMKASGITWDNETMFNWLTTPKTFIKGTAPCQGGGRGAGPTLASPSGRLAAWCPGTNMAFVGFKKPTDSADVIAFLNKNQ